MIRVLSAMSSSKTHVTSPEPGIHSDTERGSDVTVFVVARLARRALFLFGGYTAVLAAVVVAGFLGQAVGIWASILWGVGILAGLALYGRKRLSQSRAE
jgi:hypothetical protein